jgi:hypothetical protein
MTHSDDIEGLRRLHDTEEKADQWKEYAKLNREIREMEQKLYSRQPHYASSVTAGEHNRMLKVKYGLNQYFDNGPRHKVDFWWTMFSSGTMHRIGYVTLLFLLMGYVGNGFI